MHPKPKVPIYQQGLRGPGIGVVVTSTWALSAPGGYRPMSCPSILSVLKEPVPEHCSCLDVIQNPWEYLSKFALCKSLAFAVM